MTATPPLYRYAELCNGQFFSVSLNRLLIRDADDRKMPISIENLKLRHFLARRIQMMIPFGPGKDKSPVSRVIRLQGLAAMYNILAISLPENPYLRKRKRAALENKISLILDYYIRHQMYGISSYAYQEDDYSGGEEGNVSMEINFYPDL